MSICEFYVLQNGGLWVCCEHPVAIDNPDTFKCPYKGNERVICDLNAKKVSHEEVKK